MDNNQVAPAETLPVVAWMEPHEGGVITDFAKAHPVFDVYSKPLTDHAQATAEISLLKGMLETDEQIITNLREQLQTADCLAIVAMTTVKYLRDSANSPMFADYLETAVVTYQSTQGENK